MINLRSLPSIAAEQIKFGQPYIFCFEFSGIIFKNVDEKELGAKNGAINLSVIQNKVLGNTK